MLVKPLVDAFFKWCTDSIGIISPLSEAAEGIRCCLNQEKYLRVFLADSRIPINNNLSEQAIRPLCVGKKNLSFVENLLPWSEALRVSKLFGGVTIWWAV